MSLPFLSLLLLWLVAVASAQESAPAPGPTGNAPVLTADMLAPGPTNLIDQLARSERELTRAEAMGTALSRIHNHWAGGFTTGAVGNLPSGCEATDQLSLLARTPPLLMAWRDAAQSARAELVRLERLAADPILEPLWTAENLARLERVRVETVRQGPAWLEANAWQTRYVTPMLQRCKPALAPGPGLSDPLGGEPDAGPVAVLGVGGGVICPANLPADGSVVVLDLAEACYGPIDCACLVEPVLPGAVLGMDQDD